MLTSQRNNMDKYQNKIKYTIKVLKRLENKWTMETE
jgi:uncharacterized coiled-coil protein SlyX